MAGSNLKDLFEQLRGGDEQAFTQIYYDLKQPVYTICWRILQHHQMAEDVTQDVFLKLYTTVPDSSVNNERAWVFRMARNASIDALRRCRNVQMGDRIPQSEEEAFERVEQSLDVESALATLPACEREILTLYLNVELSFRQIGEMLEMSIPTVCRVYHKALKKMHRLLNGGVL